MAIKDSEFRLYGFILEKLKVKNVRLLLTKPGARCLQLIKAKRSLSRLKNIAEKYRGQLQVKNALLNPDEKCLKLGNLPNVKLPARFSFPYLQIWI